MIFTPRSTIRAICCRFRRDRCEIGSIHPHPFRNLLHCSTKNGYNLKIQPTGRSKKGQIMTRNIALSLAAVALVPTAGFAGFDWGGNGACDGSGSFEQQINQNDVVLVGEIPIGKEGVVIRLSSDKDVDIQLFDKASGAKLVQWPDGTLNGATKESMTHYGVGIEYSGYNGDGTGLGNEYIKLAGATDRELVMKAYGYAAGYATVNYAWTGTQGCTSGPAANGSGTFEQYIQKDAVVEVGELIAGLTDVTVALGSDEDVDIQLIDTASGTKIVHWPSGVLKGATTESTTYGGLTIEYSGYNGDGSGLGHEYIKITGTLDRAYTMSAYGYAAGYATVDYSWGDGSTDNGGNNGSGDTDTICQADTLVHDVQGSGSTSPKSGQTVTLKGIVVGDFQGSSELGGFFLQEEDYDADSSDETSEGVFVYHTTDSVNVGDKICVTGQVVEYNGLTEIKNVTDVTEVSTGNAMPSAGTPSLPLDDADDLERYEGMLVRFNQALFVSEHYNLARYGQLTLSSGGRLMQPTEVAMPGAAAAAVGAQNALNQIILDDGLSTQNPSTIAYPNGGLSAHNTIRGGDSVTGLTGVLYYGFSTYSVQPTQTPNFVSANPRPSAPSAVGNLKVASFNVLNFFTTLDSGSNQCGPSGHKNNCRGANSSSEYTRQRNKLIAALEQIDADVFGLMELENNEQQSAVAALADALAGYDFVRNPGSSTSTSALGTDVITVGMLYKTSTLTPVGRSETISDGMGQTLGGSTHTFDRYNRKPLLQTFRTANGARISICVNHFKSKGSLTGYSQDNDQNDGQGNNNYTRTKASEDVISWIATDPTGSNSDNILIMGDINAYSMEDPVRAFTDSGYTKLGHDYSYVYSGRWGALDHAFASPSLNADVVQVEEYHINADEPKVLDYNTEYKTSAQQSSLYSADEFRASDHDPIVINLGL